MWSCWDIATLRRSCCTTRNCAPPWATPRRNQVDIAAENLFALWTAHAGRRHLGLRRRCESHRMCQTPDEHEKDDHRAVLRQKSCCLGFFIGDPYVSKRGCALIGPRYLTDCPVCERSRLPHVRAHSNGILLCITSWPSPSAVAVFMYARGAGARAIGARILFGPMGRKHLMARCRNNVELVSNDCRST